MPRYRPRRVSTGSLRSFSGVWWSQSTWESRYRHCADAGVLLFAVVVAAAGGEVVLEAAEPVAVLAEPLHPVADGVPLFAQFGEPVEGGRLGEHGAGVRFCHGVRFSVGLVSEGGGPELWGLVPLPGLAASSGRCSVRFRV